MWEDEANKNGGRFLLRVKKTYANYFWENLLLWLIGKSSQDVCGLVSNVKDYEVLISIWIKNVQALEKAKIKEAIREALSLPENIDFDFRDHPKVAI